MCIQSHNVVIYNIIVEALRNEFWVHTIDRFCTYITPFRNLLTLTGCPIFSMTKKTPVWFKLHALPLSLLLNRHREVQWNLSIMDTFGTTSSVMIKEVSIFRSEVVLTLVHFSMHRWDKHAVCWLYRGVIILEVLNREVPLYFCSTGLKRISAESSNYA